MEVNWIVVTAVLLCVVVLVVYVIKRNNKDRQDYENYLDENDTASKENETDLEDL